LQLIQVGEELAPIVITQLNAHTIATYMFVMKQHVP
jgi:hypothetical protein